MLRNITTKSLDDDYANLLHQLYKTNIPNHLYRGYAIATNHSVIASSSRLIPSERPALYLFFGQFVNNFRNLAFFITKLSGLASILAKINEVLLSNELKTFEDIIESCSTQNDYNLCAIVTQLLIVDTLKILELCPQSIIADMYGIIAKAYHYGTIQLEEAISGGIKFSQRNNSDLDLENLKEFGFSEDKQGNNCHSIRSKNTITINFSDLALNNKDLMVVQDDTNSLLNILGRLYTEGYLPQVQKLYQEPEFPVRRGTTTISPLIEWDHRKSWYSYKFSEFKTSNTEQKEFALSGEYDDYRFIKGHVVDGRNLIPATEYLKLVWETIAHDEKLLINDARVVFENCKFIKATTMPSSGYVKLFVMFQRGTGKFEVLEKDSIVVSGKVRICEAIDQQTDLENFPSLSDDPLEIIEKDEIYRELYLRGYNYSGMFKAIEKCNIVASSGLIKWEDNWTCFIDNMLQMKLLGVDSRELAVPIGIRKIAIDPIAHLNFVKNFDDDNCLLPVYVHNKCDVIRSGGIVIEGLQAKSIFKKKSRLKPILEKYHFVPNCSSLDLTESVRVITQIILENNVAAHIKGVEIIDEFSDQDSEYVMSLVCGALEDIPLVTSDLTVSSTTTVNEIPGVKIEKVILTPESNLNLIVGSKLLQRLQTLNQMCAFLNKDGFILTRESLHCTTMIVNLDIEIVTVFTTQNEKIYLLRKQVDNVTPKCIKVSTSDFSWLNELQSDLNHKSNVILYSNNEEPEGLLGLVNCIRREPGGKNVRCFLMMDEAPEFHPKDMFYEEQVEKNLAINIYKNGVWGTYRHLLLEELSIVECKHGFANVRTRGDISSFEWLEENITRQMFLQKGQILASTFYAAVNFKDIMIASGRINPADFSNNRLGQDLMIGFEFSGKDLSGRKTAGMVNAQGISSYYAVDPLLSLEIPHSWSLEDAATVPVVYSTVVYALLIMKNLKPNSSILIHSATGGIGLAALNVCLHYECDIYVTVGTEEKREYLRNHYPQIPASHIGNSRDTSFEQMIKRETKNRGVDVVLNSLSDDKLQASIRCLARGGRFMEIGKYDSSKDTTMDLLIMEKGISFHGVHLDDICRGSNEKKTEIYKIINEGIKKGFVKPLPRVVFSTDQIEESYRYMMAGKHIGKVLIKVQDSSMDVSKAEIKANPRFNCDVSCSYIVIGGLGGVGIELADWLILRGARKLVLVSRSGLQNGYQKKRIGIWKSYGVQVQISTQKISTYQGCEDLIKEANRLGPVEAIFNLAVVLKDALFVDQNEESFLATLEPKAAATKHLDQITRRLCPKLRYFVVFSSVSCGLGNAGQTNYGMANSVMERICEKRKSEGLPAVAIQWGAIGDVGLVAKMQKENRELVIGGTLQQKISSCLEVLDTLLKHKHPVVCSTVVAEKHRRHDGALTAVEAILQILGIRDLKKVNQHTSLAELGMDSMMGTEALQILEKDFEIYLTSKDMRNLTLAKLAQMEAELKNAPIDKNVIITKQATNFMIQYLPDAETAHLPLIKLSTKAENAEGPVVFVLPGIEGTCKALETLTNQMSTRAFGIQYGYKHSEDIRELAADIASNIGSYITKNSPVVFIAYSFGAVVALEILSLLEERGYRSTGIFIDGSPTYSNLLIETHLRHEGEMTIHTDFVLKIFGLVVPFETLAQHEKTFLECKSVEEKIDFGFSLVPPENLSKHRTEKQIVHGIYTRFQSVLDYKFTNHRIKSPVYLFKATFIPVQEEHDYHLSNFCENVVQVTAVDGDHVSMLDKPELSQAIDEILTLKLGQLQNDISH